MARTAHSALLVVPANNTTMEPELRAHCRELSDLSVARVSLPPEGVNRENLDDYTRTTFEAIEPFVEEHPQLLVYGCTAAGFLAGPRASAQLAEEMHRRTKATVVATASAMIDVLKHEGVSETAVVTPYLKTVNDGLRAYLQSAGISVEVLHSCECASVDELGRVSEAEVFDMAVSTVTPDSKSLFIACSQLPTLGILEPLREALGIPVWSSISATASAISRRLAAVDERPAG